MQAVRSEQDVYILLHVIGALKRTQKYFPYTEAGRIIWWEETEQRPNRAQGKPAAIYKEKLPYVVTPRQSSWPGISRGDK